MFPFSLQLLSALSLLPYLFSLFYFQPTEDARLIQSFEGGEYRMLQR
jgi:hypothetical protein